MEQVMNKSTDNSDNDVDDIAADVKEEMITKSENKTEIINETVNETVDGPVEETVDEHVEETVDEHVDEPINERIDEHIDEHVDESVYDTEDDVDLAQYMRDSSSRSSQNKPPNKNSISTLGKTPTDSQGSRNHSHKTDIQSPDQISRNTRTKPPYVVFSLGTASLDKTAHIVQIVGVRGPKEEPFMRYVTPKRLTTDDASKITGIIFEYGQMLHNWETVDHIPIKQALRELFEYIGETPVLMVGHDIKHKDCLILHNTVDACGMLNKMASCVKGYMDTNILFEQQFPTLRDHSPAALYNRFFIKETYDAHRDALQSAKYLEKLLNCACPDWNTKKQLIFKFEDMEYKRFCKTNLLTFVTMIEQGSITYATAKKAASIGLKLEDFQEAFESGGDIGIRGVLAEVTQDKMVINDIIQFFDDRYKFVYINE